MQIVFYCNYFQGCFCCIFMPKTRTDELKTAIADQIRAFLKEKDMTQKEFASKIHKDEAYISHILQGKQNLTLETISEIERIVGRKIVRVDR